MKTNKLFLPENIFLVFGIIFGALFMVVTPPFKVPDEPNHFLRAIQIAGGNFYSQKGQQGIGGLIPESIISTMTVFDGYPFHEEKEQKAKNIFFHLRLPLEKEKKVFAAFPNTSLYSPVPYLPQVLGITVGTLFNFSPLALMYAGRVSNLAVWIFLVYLAIKLTPIQKWLFFLLALTPMSLYQAASLSADGLTNSLSFILIALCLRYALDRDRSIDSQGLAMLFAISILISLSKQAYFILSFLFLLIPVDKINSKIKYFSIFAAFILANLAAVSLWSLSIRDLYENIYVFYSKLLPNFSPSGQIRFILSHPLEYSMIFVRTMSNNAKSFSEQFIGQLGWMDINISSPLRVLYGAILIIAAVYNQEKTILHIRHKIIIFAVLSSGIALVATLAYISFNPVASPVIGAIQGRYFIPLSPLFFLLFSNSLIQAEPDNKKFNAVIIVLPVLSSLYSLFAIIQRYYN